MGLGTPRAEWSGCMSYGLQLSASGIAAAMYRQDVFANNLANLNTVGYKPDVPTTRAREAVRPEDGVFNLPSNELLERLGGGVLMRPNRVDLSQGGVRPTGGSLDLAIQGSGFFQVRPAEGSKDSLLTRDGRFTLNASGTLVMASSGAPVLDDAGQPVQLSRSAKITIDGSGAIRQRGGIVATLALVIPADPASLRKVGDGCFSVPTAGISSMEKGLRNIRQFAVEESGVNEITTLMEMTSASRSIDSNVALMQAHDKMMERAINSLGRVM